MMTDARRGPAGPDHPIHRARAVAYEIWAERSAADPVKLAKAVRVVRAALRAGRLDPADVTDGRP
jgi:hypothetical protein